LQEPSAAPNPSMCINSGEPSTKGARQTRFVIVERDNAL
jgi:hypothetical protein